MKERRNVWRPRILQKGRNEREQRKSAINTYIIKQLDFKQVHWNQSVALDIRMCKNWD
jgi:hypothetical protein